MVPKNQKIIHFWWITVLPPHPLIHLGKINNIHIREFVFHLCWPPSPSPYPLFIKTNNIHSTFFSNIFWFFLTLWLDKGLILLNMHVFFYINNIYIYIYLYPPLMTPPPSPVAYPSSWTPLPHIHQKWIICRLEPFPNRMESFFF